MTSGFGGSEPIRLINASSSHSPISTLISVIKAAHFPPAFPSRQLLLVHALSGARQSIMEMKVCKQSSTASVDLKSRCVTGQAQKPAAINGRFDLSFIGFHFFTFCS
jgi:hypothetical protein